jgi:fumarate reductase flavoprotein subunit
MKKNSRILSALVGAALILALFTGTSQPQESSKLTADVAVIGAGASGVTAAVAAADKGANVIIIEKSPTIGGASNISWGARFVNSSVAVKNGMKVDVEKTINDWITLNHWRVNIANVRDYINNSGATYDWLTSHGYPTTLINVMGMPVHLLPDHSARQGMLRKMLADSVEKNGGKVLTETAGTKLLTDDNGAVIGVQATRKDGTVLDIMAKAVIIATGGYAGNREMVKEASGFDPVPAGLPQNVGQGLKMAWAVGAAKPKNFGIQMFHQNVTPATRKLMSQYSPDKASYPYLLSYIPSLMNVTPSGERFRDELLLMNPDAAAISAIYRGPYFYAIVSKSQLDTLTREGMKGIGLPALPVISPARYSAWADKYTLDHPWADAESVLDSVVANGDGFKGASIEELARNAGMDPAIFGQTFSNYEQACKTGLDTEFGKVPPFLAAYGAGPYYAIRTEINNLASVGGLDVNKQFQVLNEKRLPIKGLYSVGLEAQGALFGDSYIGSGDGLGYAFTSGRLGGACAAGYALGQ